MSSAFDLLMKKTPKRQRPLPFFDCPAGCGARLLEREINEHLDNCVNLDERGQDHAIKESSKAPKTPKISSARVNCPSCQKLLPHYIINLHLDTNCVSQSQGRKKQAVQPNKNEDDVASLPTCSSNESGATKSFSPPPVVSKSRTGTGKHCLDSVSQSHSAPQQTDKPIATTVRAGRDVFTQMMENSKQAFATLDGLSNTCVTQSFHLGTNNHVTLRINTLPVNEVLLASRWSAMVTVKDKCEQEALPLSFEIHLSSEIASHPFPQRWIRHHSHLSIPVLKSLLQKSIRRRRPLDSVRIAMELADKALGELLRRLPVIIMEDSSLHNDLDLLIWAMMAQSKGFAPPNSTMMSIFGIIFEVASCPRKDYFVDDGTHFDFSTLTKIYKENEFTEASKSQTLLWAILVRAEYGGMKGDIKMLRKFAGLWESRFSEPSLPVEVSQVVKKPKLFHWREIPSALHAQANEHSQEQILKMLPVHCLSRENLCPEAIDFHCTSVINFMMEDKAAVGLCHDLLLLSGSEMMKPSPDSSNDAVQGPVERLAKHCMWLYSAGINRRLPLVQQANMKLNRKEDKYKHLWTELFQKRVETYQQQYINERLAR